MNYPWGIGDIVSGEKSGSKITQKRGPPGIEGGKKGKGKNIKSDQPENLGM